MAQLLQSERSLLATRVQHTLPIGLGDALGRAFCPGSQGQVHRRAQLCGPPGPPSARCEGRQLGPQRRKRQVSDRTGAIGGVGLGESRGRDG